MVAVVKRGAGQDGDAGLSMDSDASSMPAREVDNSMDKPQDKPAAAEVAGAPAKAQAKPPRRAAAGADKAAMDRAAEVLRDNPGITNAAAARLAKVSAKTVQRARPLAAPKGQELNGAKP